MADITPAASEKPTQPVDASTAAPTPVVAANPAPSDAKPADATGNKPAVAADGKPAVVDPAAKPTGEVHEAKTPEQIEADRVAAEAAAALTVPEKYELKSADGKPIDQTLVDAISPVLKDAKVTTKAAQDLVKNFTEWQAMARKAQMARDLDTLRADPSLGKLNFGRTQQRINDALAAFSSPEDRQVLTELGIANHPTLVRLFHRIGAAMQEPVVPESGVPPRAPVGTASKLYGGRDLKQSGARQ